MSKNIPLMILDGGLGTLLYSRGAFVKGDPLWSVRCLASPPESEARRQLYQAHLDYLMAGANIIKTNSYQMSPDHLRKCGAGLSQVTPPPPPNPIFSKLYRYCSVTLTHCRHASMNTNDKIIRSVFEGRLYGNGTRFGSNCPSCLSRLLGVRWWQG